MTTSEGSWLQLQLHIHDVLDLSRFRFDLTYRFVLEQPQPVLFQQQQQHQQQQQQQLATLFRGDRVPGTVCSRSLHSCDHQSCVVQSPNFPGIYPRY